MSDYDEVISKGIRDGIQASTRRLADAELAAQLEALSKSAREASAVQQGQEIVELCSEFAIWATQHNIGRNSPSLFAYGWLLGQREFDYNTVGHQGDSHTYSTSMGKLLVSHSKIRGEIIYRDDTALRFFYRGAPNYSLLPHKVDPAEYEVGTIVGSIIRFGINGRVDWP